MNTIPTALFMLVVAALLTGTGRGSLAQDQGSDRAAKAMRLMDIDGDGRISSDEWVKRPRGFKKADADGNGYVTEQELRARFGHKQDQSDRLQTRLDGLVPLDRIDRQTLCAIGRMWSCDTGPSKHRGLIETGLRPRFPDGLACRDIDERWAISYTRKRDREAYHGGIDMPAPFGTPIVAAADGTVVTVSAGEDSYRGIEVILRHSPAETGLPFWTYTQYAHFDEMPSLTVGQKVRMGQVLGPTGNSGKSPRKRPAGKQRRPAIHFAVWYSKSPEFAIMRTIVVPVDGHWMDPNAFYRAAAPYDSESLRALPTAEKTVLIPVMNEDGSIIPAGTRLVWPYRCAPA